jgi:antitoxin PrlF
MTISSKITTKGRTTIPRAVREALHIQAGDELVYKIGCARVILSKKTSLPDDAFATFAEWSSAYDRRAYRDL